MTEPQPQEKGMGKGVVITLEKKTGIEKRIEEMEEILDKMCLFLCKKTISDKTLFEKCVKNHCKVALRFQKIEFAVESNLQEYLERQYVQLKEDAHSLVSELQKQREVQQKQWGG
jgi:hypothetical protein